MTTLHSCEHSYLSSRPHILNPIVTLSQPGGRPVLPVLRFHSSLPVLNRHLLTLALKLGVVNTLYSSLRGASFL